MDTMIENILSTGNQTTTLVLLTLACIRVYLEIIGFDFLELPLTKAMAKNSDANSLRKFHKMGLIFSVGYILIVAPSLFSL